MIGLPGATTPPNDTENDEAATPLLRRISELMAQNSELQTRLANAELRAATAEARARTYAADPITANFETMKALNRQEPRRDWMPFATMVKKLPPGFVSPSTVRAWCESSEIVHRQRRSYARLEVDVESFWARIALYAQQKCKPFVRPV